MSYYGSNNDWWGYLQHSQEGKERKNHKYYARVPVGKNKFGFTQYRYFYDAREYGAYMTRSKNGKSESKYPNIKGVTFYNTGSGKAYRNKAGETIENGKTIGENHFTVAKTVHDSGETVRKVKRTVKAAVKRGSDKVKRLLSNAWVQDVKIIYSHGTLDLSTGKVDTSKARYTQLR